MLKPASRIGTASVAALAVVVVLIMACRDETPTGPPQAAASSFGAVRAAMAAPFDHTTVARLNRALGRDDDAPMAVVSFLPLSSDLRWTVKESGQGVAEAAPRAEATTRAAAASASGPDPDCEFKNGGSLEEWNAYVRCVEAAEGECTHELVTSVETGDDGVARLNIDALHYHCAT